MQKVWMNVLAVAGEHLQGVEWSFNSTISMVRRRWIVLVASIALCVGMMAVLLVFTPSQYTAESLLQINTRQEQVTKMEDVMSGLSGSESAIRTEVDVLKSRKLAARIIERQKLLGNEDFMASTSFFSQLKGAFGFFLFPLRDSVQKDEVVSSAEMTKAVNLLLQNLDVSMLPRSYSIKISYTARTPELAAKITNSLAQEYLNSQLEDKFEATKRANDWINVRLKELQKSVQASELAVRKYREENGLTQASGVTLNDQQLSELNSQLILARTQQAEAEARITSTSRGVGNTTEVLNSPLIQNLRIQETEVRRKMSDLASRYGERHPRMQTVRNELADVQRKISEETYKIRGSLDNSLDMAKARVKTLQEQLDALQNKNQMNSGAAVQLGELERQAQAERNLYEAFLGRSKEIAQMDFGQTDARVISPAENPLNPSKPRKMLMMLVAVVAGVGIGVGLMLALEALDSGFRTSTQLEQMVNVPVLGMLGELPHEEDIAHYVVKKPTGAFTEAVRGVRTAMQFANPDKPAKVIVVTSSVPQEGKSLFAISLAQLTAKGGSKVLLVDADLRRPSVSKQLGLKSKAGLAEVLVDQVKAKDVLVTLKDSKLDVMPAVANTQFAQELLNSKKMKDLLAEWRKTYDLIVVDCPPVMAVSDAVTMSTNADAMLFMVRWGSTPRQLAANSIRQLQAARAPLAGTVMTRIDLEKQQAYGYGDYGYYYGKYKEYYND